MLQHKQFGGHAFEDPNGHLSNFFELCEMIKMNEVNHDIIKLMLFPLSWKEKTRYWFHNLTQGSIDTWEEIEDAFLTKYFMPQLTSQL